MNAFVASSGIRVRVAKAFGDLEMIGAGGPDGSWEFVLNSAGVEALREFFLAEHDAELGRWRSKEHPKYVVYDHRESNFFIHVVDEEIGTAQLFGANGEFQPRGASEGEADVAREFFAAHPEPKPWHDAKAGEVWALTVSGRESAWSLDEDLMEWCQASTGSVLKSAPRSPAITAGRRIWPES